jgi:hypothetical protein
MFHGSSTFVRFGNARRWASQSWWLVFGPGVALMLLALAIIVWPQLLAYLIAGAIFFAGVTLAGWGLALRRAEQARARQRDAVYYEVS